MAPKGKTSDAGSSDVPKRSHNVLPLSKKVKVLNKKKKSYAEVASAVRMNV